MKCVICPEMGCQMVSEAEGFKMRVNASVINGASEVASLNTEVTVPFSASSVTMTNAIKTKVRDEFQRLNNLTVSLSDIVLVGGGVS